MSRKIQLIFNPIANLGRAHALEPGLRAIIADHEGADWANTTYPTHAVELARQAGEQGYDLVIAMGGDGTVHEVVNGLMQLPADRRPALGIVPVGSGNDFAYSLGLSSEPHAALRQVLTGQSRPVDIGYLHTEDGPSEYWTNSIGIGFNAIVVIRSRQVRVVSGFGIYLVAVLQTILLNHFPFHLRVNGSEAPWQDRLLMLSLSNGQREGGGFHIAPGAQPDDGLLEYMGIRHISRSKMLYTVPFFMRKEPPDLPYIFRGQFRRFEIDSDRPLVIHADGEILSGLESRIRQLQVEIIPAAIQACR